MRFKSLAITAILLTVVLSASVGWAANIYYRSGRYQLPGVYQSRVLDTILTDHKRQIDALAASNAALTARVTMLEARMQTAETGIATNAQDIAANEAGIAANDAAIAMNAQDIAANEAAIAANDAAIATNDAAIATNAQAVAVNAAGLAVNVAAIASNTSSISGHVADTSTAHSYDARYVRTSDTSERMVVGALNDDGTIYRGAGFTAVRNSIGSYTVTFTTPLAGNARAVVAALDGMQVDGWSLGNTELTITCTDSAGALADAYVMFLVTGR